MHVWIITLQWEDHRRRVNVKTLTGKENLRGRSKADMLDNVRRRAASDAGVSAESLAVLVFTVELDKVSA